jgi:hypothetical protein
MTTTRLPSVILVAALAWGCKGPAGTEGAPGAPGVATAQAPLQLGAAGALSIATAGAASAGALSAADWAVFDAKLNAGDGRVIHNGTAPQSADIHVTGGVTAGTVTAGGFAYAAPVTRVIALPPAAFLPVKAGVAYDGQAAGSARWVTSGAIPAWLVAPLSLPNGVTLLQLRCNVISSSATSPVTISFMSCLADGTWPSGPVVSTSAASATAQAMTLPLSGQVGAATTVLSVGFRPADPACGSGCQLLGCWLTYAETAVH